MAFDAIFVLNLVLFERKRRIRTKVGLQKNPEEPVLTEDEMSKVREQIDWCILVLKSLSNCRDRESLIFGMQKVWKRVTEILTTAEGYPNMPIEGTSIKEEGKRGNSYY